MILVNFKIIPYIIHGTQVMLEIYANLSPHIFIQINIIFAKKSD